jgi:hypothetical protein
MGLPNCTPTSLIPNTNGFRYVPTLRTTVTGTWITGPDLHQACAAIGKVFRWVVGMSVTHIVSRRNGAQLLLPRICLVVRFLKSKLIVVPRSRTMVGFRLAPEAPIGATVGPRRDPP